ncbi:MAG: futalosine hydrolase [Pedobacter sp.]|nr:MAG: futalosine hydrolase [Pedobacter sp.]
MKMLIVAATQAEIEPLMMHFNLAGSDFITNKEFDILITGVGMTATAYALGIHLSKKYNLVLNLGIAGCFDRSIALGTVVNIYEDTFAELGAEDHENFLSIDDLGFGKSKHTAFNNLLSESVAKLRKVRGITVNRVHGNGLSISAIATRFSPITESMEGAAVLYCCGAQDIPCLQIRSISNYVEPRNTKAWKINLALKSLNNWAIEFLTNT